MTDETRAVLLRAKELVEQGWCQGIMERRGMQGETCHCLFGALMRAKRDLDLPYADAAMATHNHLFRLYGNSEMSGMILWNDAPGRTQAEVVKLLEEVAGE